MYTSRKCRLIITDKKQWLLGDRGVRIGREVLREDSQRSKRKFEGVMDVSTILTVVMFYRCIQWTLEQHWV